MENPIKMDDLGVPLFLEIPIYTFWGERERGVGGISKLGQTFPRVYWNMMMFGGFPQLFNQIFKTLAPLAPSKIQQVNGKHKET